MPTPENFREDEAPRSTSRAELLDLFYEQASPEEAAAQAASDGWRP